MLKNILKESYYNFIILTIIFFISSNAKPITLERINNDKDNIQQFLKNTKQNVGLAQTFGKWVCWASHGLTYRAYDCMPQIFFNDKNFKSNINTIYTEKDIAYMNENKSHIEKNFVKKNKIDDSQLAEYLFERMVDRLSLSLDQKIKIKKDPIDIGKYIVTEPLRAEYMNITQQNLISHYYAQQDIEKK